MEEFGVLPVSSCRLSRGLFTRRLVGLSAVLLAAALGLFAAPPAAAQSADATLSGLTATSSTSAAGTFSALTLSPSTFAATTVEYSALVANSISHVKLAPTVNESNATVKVGKGATLTAVSSGSESGAIALDVGANAVTVELTAQDGTTTKTYMVRITRQDANGQPIWAATLTAENLVTTLFGCNNGSPIACSDTSRLTDDTFVLNGTTHTVASITINSGDLNFAISSSSSAALREYSLHVGGEMFPLHMAVSGSWSTAQTWSAGQVLPVTLQRAAAVAPDGAPTDLLLGQEPGKLIAIWTAPTDTGSRPISGYDVQYKLTSATDEAATTAGDPSTGWVDAVHSGITARGAITGLTDDTSHDVRVRAVNEAGGGPWVTGMGTPGRTLWSDTLTIADGGANGLGCIGGGATSCFTNAANNLNDDGFVIDGGEVTITRITVNNGTLKVQIQVAPSTRLKLYSFHVGTTAFALSSATISDRELTWSNTGLSWTAGSTVSLSLRLPQSVTLPQSNDATLSALTATSSTSPTGTFSALALSPDFAAGTTAYTASVANAMTHVRLTPTVSAGAATVKVGKSGSLEIVADGEASGAIFVVEGTNAILVEVTAEDGTTTNRYTVTVTRAAASTDATLSALVAASSDAADGTFGALALSPVFAAGTTAYTASVANGMTHVRLTAMVAATGLATLKVGKGGGTLVAVDSGTASGAIALAEGANAIKVEVTAEDGSKSTYTVTVTRAEPQSMDATLSALTATGGTSVRGTFSALTFSPSPFAATTVGYSVLVANATRYVKLTPTVNESNATVKVGKGTSLTAVNSGSDSGAIALTVGANEIAVVVTAQDGTTIKTYMVRITRQDAGGQPIWAATLTVGNNGGVIGCDNGRSGIECRDESRLTDSAITLGTTTHRVEWLVIDSGNLNIQLRPAYGAALREYSFYVGTTAFALSAATISTNFASWSNTGLSWTAGDKVSLSLRLSQSAPQPLSTDATLSALVAASSDAADGTFADLSLSPVFAVGTTEYTAAVANAVTHVQLTATVSDTDKATLKVGKGGGTLMAVDSGTASGAIALAEGTNAIEVEVTAEDGTTTNRYAVTVTRAAASTDATLSALVAASSDAADGTFSALSLSPVFAVGTTEYTASVVNDMTHVQLTATVSDTGLATLKVGKSGSLETVADGEASGAIALAVGANAIEVEVTAEDGTTTETYTVTVTRAAASTDATLSALVAASSDAADGTFTDLTLSPVFAAGTTGYTASVVNAVTHVKLTATVSATGLATLKVGKSGSLETVADGEASGAIALAEGTNAIEVEVTAEDGTTTETYTVTVTRAAALSTDATLSALVVESSDAADGTFNALTLSPVFAAGTTAYRVSVATERTHVRLTATVSATGLATLKVGKRGGTLVAVGSGTASGAIALSRGFNVLEVEVTAEDGTTTETYTVEVTVLSAEATALSISVEGEVVEGMNTGARIVATLDGPAPLGGTEVLVVLSDGTAKAGSDYVQEFAAREGEEAGIRITIEEGEIRGTGFLPVIIDDEVVEFDDETIFLDGKSSNPELVASRAVLVIREDPRDREGARVAFGEDPSSVVEYRVEVNEESGRVLLPVVANKVASSGTRFAVEVVSGGTTALEGSGGDFELVVAEVVHDEMVSGTNWTQNIELRILDDEEEEGRETVQLRIVAADSVVDDAGDYFERDVLGSLATVVIVDNDAVVSLSADSLVVEEGETALVTATLSRALEYEVEVPIVLEALSAEDGDYGVLSGIVIAVGATMGTGVLETNEDADGDNETFRVSLGSEVPVGLVLGSSRSVVVTIADDEAVVSLSALPNPVEEGGVVEVTASLNQALDYEVEVPIVLEASSAEDGDYGALSGIVIARGETVGTGLLETSQDADAEDETFRVSLGSELPRGLVLGSSSSVVVSIEDDEVAVSLSALPNPVEEGDSVVVTAVLTESVSGEVVIPIVLEALSAESEDYGALSGIVIAGGETMGSGVLETKEDTDVEDETFRVSLGGELPLGVVAGRPAVVEVVITDDDLVSETAGKLHRAVLPEVARAMAGRTTEVIGERVGRVLDGEEETGTLSLAGQPTVLEAISAGVPRVLSGGDVLPLLLSDSGFALPLSAVDGGGGVLSSAVLWGSGDWRSLSGAEDGLDWDGEWYGVQVGVDKRLHESVLAGVALSWGRGDFAYREGSVGSGDYEMDIWSVHPYVGWRMGGVDIWATGGYGGGEVEFVTEGGEGVAQEVAVWSMGVGGSGELWSSGDMAVRLRGELLRTEVEVEEVAEVSSLSVVATLARVGLEGSRTMVLSGGGEFRPSVSFGGRHDGGDGDTGTGAELRGGLGYVSAGGRLSAELSVHGLLGRGDYEEWGVSGQVALLPSIGGGGWSFALRPGYGSGIAEGGSTGRIWGQGVRKDALDAVVSSAGMRVESRLGYGLVLREGRGLVTPWGGMTLNDGGRRYQLGLDWGLGSLLRLNLSAERREAAGLRTDHAVFMEGETRF